MVSIFLSLYHSPPVLSHTQKDSARRQSLFVFLFFYSAG